MIGCVWLQKAPGALCGGQFNIPMTEGTPKGNTSRKPMSLPVTTMPQRLPRHLGRVWEEGSWAGPGMPQTVDKGSAQVAEVAKAFTASAQVPRAQLGLVTLESKERTVFPWRPEGLPHPTQPLPQPGAHTPVPSGETLGMAGPPHTHTHTLSSAASGGGRRQEGSHHYRARSQGLCRQEPPASPRHPLLPTQASTADRCWAHGVCGVKMESTQTNGRDYSAKEASST